MAGAAVRDITPPPGLTMAGFAARTEPATGTHDALTARALVIDDTAVLAVDVLGLDGAMSARIREKCQLPSENVIIAATHTHGGPATLPGRAGGNVDQTYLAHLESACTEALDDACNARRPARLEAGRGGDPKVGQNRRHQGGLTDPATPALRVRGIDGTEIAILASYACHPVTLGPDNRLWTGDYVHFAREKLEAATGAVAVFLTGCCGDVNTGHSAAASMTLSVTSERSFATAKRLGTSIAEAILKATFSPRKNHVSARNAWVALPYLRRETDVSSLAAQWRAEHDTAETSRQILLQHWIAWAEKFVGIADPLPWYGRVTVLNWGGVTFVALPGEIFSRTGLDIRAAGADFVVAYAESFPGYLPPREEYPFGGYEVDEAHRFIGTPSGFAPGAAESLAQAAIALATGA